jgi:hypothetical protein
MFTDAALLHPAVAMRPEYPNPAGMTMAEDPGRAPQVRRLQLAQRVWVE